MGAVGVMIAPPAGDATNILKAVEDLAVEQFVPQAGIIIFPKASWSMESVVTPSHAVRRLKGRRRARRGDLFRHRDRQAL